MLPVIFAHRYRQQLRDSGQAVRIDDYVRCRWIFQQVARAFLFLNAANRRSMALTFALSI